MGTVTYRQTIFNAGIELNTLEGCGNFVRGS
jgi:hypothetical protein